MRFSGRPKTLVSTAATNGGSFFTASTETMSSRVTIPSVTTRRLSFLLLIGGLVSLILLACEGPTGPEGPEGEQGPQGEAGTDPRIINLKLNNHVGRTAFDRGSNTLTPEDDTLSIRWGATMDTTISSVTIADSQYVETYVRVPGVGFQRAPLRFEFDGVKNVSNVERGADAFSQVDYNLLEQLPSPSPGSLFVAGAVGGADRRYYTAVTDQSDIHEAVVEPDELSVRIRAYGARNGSDYESGIAVGITSLLVPFDSDLTDADAGFYPTADGAGDVVYERSTTDLGAIQDSVGTDLRLEEYELEATKEGSFSGVIRSADWEANPRPGQVEIRAAWGRDSIKVAAVMTGTNYGRDRTIYTQKMPVEVRIAIVSGSLAKKMRNGATVPFSRIRRAAALH